MMRLIFAFTIVMFAVLPGVAAEKTHPLAAGIAELQKLKQGNERFAAGKPLHPHQTPARRMAAMDKDVKPFAAVLTCSDAATPPEIIMDAGFGDLFVLRTPAGLANAGEAAALEYAMADQGISLLVVMGHPDCKLVCDLLDHANLSARMSNAADGVLTAIDRARDEFIGLQESALATEAARLNVWQSIERIFKFSGDIRHSVLKGKLLVMGAFYEPKTGGIEWMGRLPDERAIIKLYDTPADLQ